MGKRNIYSSFVFKFWVTEPVANCKQVIKTFLLVCKKYNVHFFKKRLNVSQTRKFVVGSSDQFQFD